MQKPDGGDCIKKLIVLTQRVERIEGIGERRDALSQEWTMLADHCGFLPLPLPNHLPTVQQMMAALPVEGILLTGGNDLAVYGGDAPERDEVERYLIEQSLCKKIPLLGVCRGMQMILHHFGTPLQQIKGHIHVEHPLSDGTMVNSFHGWGAVECKLPLVSAAWSGDGVLEAVTHQECPWIQGIMWHPERYVSLRLQDMQWFKEGFQL